MNGYVKGARNAMRDLAVAASGKKQRRADLNGKALESACQEKPPICLAAYFRWLASSHRMAARSNSVNEVTPNFSLARAQ